MSTIFLHLARIVSPCRTARRDMTWRGVTVTYLRCDRELTAGRRVSGGVGQDTVTVRCSTVITTVDLVIRTIIGQTVHLMLYRSPLNGLLDQWLINSTDHWLICQSAQ